MKREMIIALRSLTKHGRNNGIKIISLAAGLAMGLVLIAKVCFEQSYDAFYPDSERIYRLNQKIIQNNELKEYPQVSGGVAVGMREEVPGVEMATRCTGIYDGEAYTDDGKGYTISVIAADEYFFDVFPRKILQGDAKAVLSKKGAVLISEELARKIGGDVMGKTLCLGSKNKNKIPIGGVFETVPENAHQRYDAVITLQVMVSPDYDGTINWLGNDRYRGYVKLYPGVEPDSLAEPMRAMQRKHQDFEALKKAGVDLSYTLTRLTDLHRKTPEVKSMTSLLIMLAFVLIFAAVMNYVLVVISSFVSRTKEVAVHKCYGASGRNIGGMIVSETFLHLLISIALALLLIFAFRGTVEELLAASLRALFSSQSITILVVVCMVVFLVTGLLPGHLFARIPVGAAFRNYRESRRYWKLALLFVQFIGVGFLFSFLVIITLQHKRMTNDHPGYNCEQLAYFNMADTDSTLRSKIIDEVGRLPEVAAVTTFSELPFEKQSGNNVYLPGNDREMFNIADLYWVGNRYLETMEIPVVGGRSFTENVPSSHEVMVSRRFVEKMKNFADWSDGAIGKEILITEHSQSMKQPFTICGVYEDIRLNSIENEDTRPSVMFYAPDVQWTRMLLVKFHTLTPEGMTHVQETIQALLPDQNVAINDWRADMTNLYRSSRLFRDSVMIGCIITLIIALTGLIGYTRDEINRRRKEIAIRKINGATFKEVLLLFERDIIRIAVPALIGGCALAAYSAAGWLSGFSEKVSLAWYLFAICGLMMLGVIITVVAFHIRSAANDNPVKSLRSE